MKTLSAKAKISGLAALKSFWFGRLDKMAYELRSMKNTIKQEHIAWVRNEIGKEIFVVVDSSPITYTSCKEAARLIEEDQSVDSFVPMIFLDEKLDSTEMRSRLQSKAVQFFISGKSRQ